ncbi:MAG: hypothetical protein OSA51_08310 [Octadecabacter sp.]|nr:hypothetical protein [Octadecabacter sp.]
MGKKAPYFQLGAFDHLPTAHLGLAATAQIVSATYIPGHLTSGAYCGNMLVLQGWIMVRGRA